MTTRPSLDADDPLLWGVSSEYDRLANERDAVADERDAVALERDRLAEVRDQLILAGTPGPEWIELSGADRRAAARDRARAAEDRRLAGRDRERAGRERRMAMTALEKLRVQAAEHDLELLDLRRADLARQAFLIAVAHDLRSPVTALLGFGELLERRIDELAPEQIRDTAARISASARHMQSVLDNLLDMERLRSGHVGLRAIEADVVAIARACVARLEPAERRVRIEPDSLEARADAGIVERIVDNLLLNAVRHTPDATEIVLRFEVTELGLRIACDDEGPGVPDELKEQIFEAYRQGNASNGLGLGLYLVRSFAELHCGRVWVEDRRGGGASFVVQLGAPVAAPTPAAMGDRRSSLVLP